MKKNAAECGQCRAKQGPQSEQGKDLGDEGFDALSKVFCFERTNELQIFAKAVGIDGLDAWYGNWDVW